MSVIRSHSAQTEVDKKKFEVKIEKRSVKLQEKIDELQQEYNEYKMISNHENKIKDSIIQQLQTEIERLKS